MENIQQNLIELEGNTRIGANIEDTRLYNLEDQIYNLNNLGIDYLSEIDIENNLDKIIDLLHYINQHYISIPFINQIENDTKAIEKIYHFLFVDMYNVILPNFIHVTKFKDYNSIDEFIQLRYLSDNNELTRLKEDLLDVIERIIKSINKWQNLLSEFDNVDNNAITEIMNKYASYAQIIGSNDNISLRTFLKRYIIPVIRKNEEDLLWRNGS